jgi:RHS repeat-associated protein
MNYTATHTSFCRFWLADARTEWITTRGFTGHVQRNTVFESEVHQKQSVEPIPKTKEIGKHLDKFGLINANARMYEPLTGKFLAPDPYVQAPDYSQSFNRYTYCWNNPVKYSDPSGEKQYYFEKMEIIVKSKLRCSERSRTGNCKF